MTSARDMMHVGVECVQETDTVADAAELMRDLHVGALPICGADQRLHGILTDRDITVRCVADGHDPAKMTVRELAGDTLIWVDAEADQAEVLRLMEDNKIRRLPVIDEHRLVGIISQADLAVHLNEHQLSEFVNSIHAAQPTN